MAYEGSIELISGIKQKNNQTFPLIDAEAVYVDDDNRLTNVLSKLVDIQSVDELPENPDPNTLYLIRES